MTLFHIWLISFIGCLVASSHRKFEIDTVIYFALAGWLFFPMFAMQRIGFIMRNLLAGGK